MCRMKCTNPPIVCTCIHSPGAKSTSTHIRSHFLLKISTAERYTAVITKTTVYNTVTINTKIFSDTSIQRNPTAHY